MRVILPYPRVRLLGHHGDRPACYKRYTKVERLQRKDLTAAGVTWDQNTQDLPLPSPQRFVAKGPTV
ncbi:hypothetical protein NOVOSPHI9U_210025 [Novosphingobium sp. 9U]|nr:hypothetical protein NOVOSPHI9U_210025 [Novosphingobium sp. 9U]